MEPATIERIRRGRRSSPTGVSSSLAHLSLALLALVVLVVGAFLFVEWAKWRPLHRR
jgi:hypothetical protein